MQQGIRTKLPVKINNQTRKEVLIDAAFVLSILLDRFCPTNHVVGGDEVPGHRSDLWKLSLEGRRDEFLRVVERPSFSLVSLFCFFLLS